MFGHFNPVTDMPDLTGKVALVTGANSGIGYQTALQLANHGAKLHITTRSEAKARETIRRLEEQNPALKDSGRLHWLVLNLSLVSRAKAAAEEFLSRETRLDILINNAGQLASDFALTSEGLSDIFAADHVSPFVFTSTLLPLLEATAKLPGADVRVITVASSQHLSALPSTKFESIDDFRSPCSAPGKENSMDAKMARYRQAKLANVLFAKELQRRWDEAGVKALSMSLHPGDVATEGAERMVRSMPLGSLAWPLITWWVMTSAQGAITSLFAATSPAVREEREKYKGQYLVPYGCVGKTSELARREGWAEGLWALTERVVREIEEKGSVAALA